VGYTDEQILVAAEALLTLLESSAVDGVDPELEAQLRALLARAHGGTVSANDVLTLVLRHPSAHRSMLTVIPEAPGGDIDRRFVLPAADSELTAGAGAVSEAPISGNGGGYEDDGDGSGVGGSGAGGDSASGSGGSGSGSGGYAGNRARARSGPSPPPPVSEQPRLSPRRPRWLLSKVYDVSGAKPRALTRAFRAGVEHDVAVMIGPKRRGWLAASSGPSVDDVVPSGAQKVTIVFVVPDQRLHMAQSLVLPADGPSAECRFRFTAGEAGMPTKVLISLVHRGRALQTAELTAVAVEDPTSKTIADRIAFSLAVVTPNLANLDTRQPFDGSIQVSRDSYGRLVGFATADPERSTLLPDFGSAVEGIRSILSGLTYASDRFGRDITGRASVDFLRDLAFAGGELNTAIGAPLSQFATGDAVTRVQIVQTDPGLFVPIEFIYDLPPPSNDATLCSNWQQALEQGHCEEHFHHPDEVTGQLMEICPSGFWAVSKVIERQSVEQTAVADLAPGLGDGRNEPSATRAYLGQFTSALFAWSELLDAEVSGQSGTVLKALEAATGRAPLVAHTWREWAKAVGSEHPPLLVLLSHTTADIPARLEIGADAGGEKLALSQIMDAHVRGGKSQPAPGSVGHGPVVVLLGCDTAIADQAAYSFAAKFRERGAAVVVGTLTSVLGEHVAPVTSALVEALSRAANEAGVDRSPETFGEVWRRTRSRLLAQGELAALCVTAFGDADWFVGVPAEQG
jgi:hypothetical protein